MQFHSIACHDEHEIVSRKKYQHVSIMFGFCMKFFNVFYGYPHKCALLWAVFFLSFSWNNVGAWRNSIRKWGKRAEWYSMTANSVCIIVILKVGNAFWWPLPYSRDYLSITVIVYQIINMFSCAPCNNLLRDHMFNALNLVPKINH